MCKPTTLISLVTAFFFSFAVFAQTATYEKQTTVEEGDKGEKKVETIEQKIENTGETTPVVSDTDIISAVKSALATETSLAPFAINVNSANKIVTLQGQVDTLEQLITAVMVAASVHGVETVMSDGFTVKGLPTPPPGAIIIGNAKGGLVRQGFLTKEEAMVLPLTVEVSDGVISVSGALQNEDIKTFVLKSIDSTAGGKTVTSKLTVINEPQP